MAKIEKQVIRRKKFINVEIPITKSKVELIANEPKEVVNRTIKLDLTRQLKGKSVEMTLKIILEKNKAVAYPFKIKLLSYFIRRMIRKRISYVEDSFTIPSQNSMILIKPFLITKRRVSRSVRKTLRNKTNNWITDTIKEKTDSEIFNEILSNRFQKTLSLYLKKTYPLSLCEIRMLEIIRPLKPEEVPKIEKKLKIEKIAEGIDQLKEIEDEKIKAAEEEIKKTQEKALKLEESENKEEQTEEIKEKPKKEEKKKEEKPKKERKPRKRKPRKNKMAIEQTLVIVKPDGVERGLVGEVIKRIEQRGLKIVALKLTKIDKDFSKKHYTEDIAKRRGKKVREMLLDYISSGPVVVMIVEGVDAIENVRKLCGDTESKSAIPGTIRGDFTHVSYKHADEKQIPVKNIVHASGNAEDAKNEVALWFSIDEIHSYKRVEDHHVL